MSLKSIFLLIFTLFIFSCDQIPKSKLNLEFQEKYKNSGFALIYDDQLQNVKKLEKRSLNIFHKTLKKRSIVKILNPNNGKYLIAEVKSNRVC